MTQTRIGLPILDCRTQDETKSNFLQFLENIEPSKNLAETNFESFFKKLVNEIKTALKRDASCLLIVINAIKDSGSQRFKQGSLLKAIDAILTKDTEVLKHLVNNPSDDSCLNWKDLSNSLVSLPNVFANTDPKRELCPNFDPQTYYGHLLKTLYESSLCDITEPKRWLCVQIMGRIALSDNNNLIWTHFLSRLIQEKNEDSKKSLSQILTIPLQDDTNNVIKRHFQLYIEPLYVPIFFHLTPNKDSGPLILSLLGDYILANESFEYLICNKLLLQTCHNLERKRQYRILFNIFAYLVALDSENCIEDSRIITSLGRDDPQPSESLEICKQGEEQYYEHSHDRTTTPNRFLFIETLLELAKSWSSRSKMLLRSHEHNRYISCAIIVAMRYLSGCKEITNHHGNYQQLIRYISIRDKNKSKLLRQQVDRLQSTLMQGFPIYLNRSSMNERQLAICVGEVALERLHAIIIDLDQGTSASGTGISGGGKHDKSSSAPKLEFGIQLDADGQDMKRLYDIDLECLFNDMDSMCQQRHQHQPAAGPQTNTTIESGDPVAPDAPQRRESRASDLAPAAIHDDDDEDEGSMDSDEYCLETQNSEQSGCLTNVPLYVRDCMNGLAENNNPRYVRLCLTKAGELIEKLCLQNAKLVGALRPQARSQGANRNARSVQSQSSSSPSYSQMMAMNISDSHLLLPSKQSQNDDAIRDIVVEFVQILLHLDDQFCLEGFYEKRINLMSLLCTAAPDLAIKYLLDEFNGDNVSIRHQLDILQALVRSAKLLSSGSMAASAKEEARNPNGANRTAFGGRNRFVEHVSLYFYGLVHRLKADISANLSISTPSSILSMTKTPSGGGQGSVGYSNGKTMMKRVISGLASSASQLRSLDENFARIRLLDRRASGVVRVATTTRNSKSSTVLVEVDDKVIEMNECSEATNTTTTSTTTSTTSTTSTSTTPMTSTKTATASAAKRLGSRDLGGQQVNDEKDDSSYLLSRIFLSLSLILGCVNQQPIACKLSEDLLDIMAAFKSHPDAGVRQSISACLITIRDCTPSVYLEEMNALKSFSEMK